MKNKVELADYIIARHNDLVEQRRVYEPIWQECADYCLPRKAEITTKQDYPSLNRSEVLYDSTAVYSNSTLANGQLSYMTPADTRWFVYDPPAYLKNSDRAKQWFSRCSEIVQQSLANSNFYSEVHELYFDDGTFGTYAMYCEEGKTAPVVFQTFPVPSFAIAENDEGLVDTLFREMRLTCQQMAEKFGQENLSPVLQKKLEEYLKTGKGGSVRHDVIHAIYPRTERDPSKLDAENKPFASVYVEKATKHLIRNSGFDEKPFFAGRHLKWSHSPYGWSPAWIAVPEARQLNFLCKQLDALAEVKAFPRLLIPATHEGEIDLRAAGTTYFDPTNPNARPVEWASAGDYNIGLEREKSKQEAIAKAFHVDMFRMFSMLEKQMTAREVAERSSEKLAQFSPTFALKTTELFNPLLRRVFSIHLRRGLLPPPPQDVLVPNETTGIPEIPEPEIQYVSRVALAIKSLNNLAFMRTMERIAPVVQIRPEVMDNYNWDRIARDTARNDGTPADWLMEEEEVATMREERQAQQAAAMEQQQMMAQAEMASKAGNIKTDSVIGQAIAQQQA
jgi:hypothetical protein